MSRRALIWPAGLLASGLSHGGAALALIWALEPEPVSEQPVPESRMQVETYEIDRTEAALTEPDSDAATAEAPEGTNLSQGAIPQGEARPVTAEPEALAARDDPAEAVAATPPDAAPVQDAAQSQAQRTRPVAPDTQSASAARPTADALAEADLRAEPAGALASTSVRLAPATGVTETLSAATGRAEPLAPSTGAAVTLTPAVGAAEALTPALGTAETLTPALGAAETLTAALGTAEPLTEARPGAVTLAPQTTPGATLSAARPDTPAVRPLSATPAPTSAVIPETSQAEPAEPDLRVAVLARPETTAATDAPTDAQIVPQSEPDSPSAFPAEPDLGEAALAQPEATVARDAPAEGQAAVQSDPDAPRLDPAEPDVIKGRAELAFAGADGDVDPVSLAAFQSFMSPETGAAAEVRDGLSGILSQVPCSRMQVTFEPEQNTLQLTGHVPEDALRVPVLAALQAQMGADIVVADNLLVLPSPQCDALTGIADVGLPQSTDQITNPLIVGADAHAREFRYAEGDRLILDLAAPDYDAFVYVDYFDASGQVIHLSPNESVPLVEAPEKSALRIGADAPGEPGLFITIGPPYGQEIAVAFAASVPLYEGTRPLVEPAAAYLEWMAERVAEARAAHPDFKGEWVYFFVTTRAR